MIIAPPQVYETGSDQGGHKTHISPFDRYILPEITNLRTAVTFTLKIVAWNELTTKHWLTGQTWIFMIKFINYGTSPR